MKLLTLPEICRTYDLPLDFARILVRTTPALAALATKAGDGHGIRMFDAKGVKAIVAAVGKRRPAKA